MKQRPSYLLGALSIVAIIVYRSNTTNIETLPDGSNVAVMISQNTDTDLNNFLALYQSGTFESIKLIDAKQLVWYSPVSGTNTRRMMSFGQPVMTKSYQTTTTNKPIDTSIGELGISITGTTRIDTIYNQPTVLWEIGAQILSFLVVLLIIVGLMRFMWPKQMGMPFNFSVGKLKKASDPKTSFSDVAGMEECKAELQEIVDYLKNPEKYIKVWARPPKWVLLHWAPGWGKTLLARAVAGEANVPFFSASGSEFMEMLVGMGAAKVRDLFRKAKATSPSIIFIDEIDAIGKKRGNGHTGGHQEQEQTLNQILTEMDGFENDTKVIVVAATNRPDVLDPALLRAGRFDRKVFVGRPTLEEREAIIKYYLKDKKVTEGVGIESLAKRTTGLVGADIENIINEASLKLAREDRTVLTAKDFEFALEKVIMGPEKKIKSIKEKERKLITYHELGHAITAHLLPNADPVEKISIVSRGMALGVTWMMPEEDKYLYSKAKFLDECVCLLWGRASEEIVFGKDEITTGASNDLERVTRIITDMIVKYGMDKEIWLSQYKTWEDTNYDFYRPYSEQTAEKIDTKIRTIIAECYEQAKKILSDNVELMHTLASVLLEKEYLTKEEFESLMKDPSGAEALIQESKRDGIQAAKIRKDDEIEVVKK